MFTKLGGLCAIIRPAKTKSDAVHPRSQSQFGGHEVAAIRHALQWLEVYSQHGGSCHWGQPHVAVVGQKVSSYWNGPIEKHKQHEQNK